MRRKEERIHQKDGPASAEDIHKAFRRMAILLANLVCGIWLVLLIATTALNEDPPGWGAMAVVLLLSGPVAYGIPYGVVRIIGLLVVRFRRPDRN